MGLIRGTVQLGNPIRADLAPFAEGTGAMVLGDAVLLGAIPMEDMDPLLRPQRPARAQRSARALPIRNLP